MGGGGVVGVKTKTRQKWLLKLNGTPKGKIYVWNDTKKVWTPKYKMGHLREEVWNDTAKKVWTPKYKMGHLREEVWNDTAKKNVWTPKYKIRHLREEGWNDTAKKVWTPKYKMGHLREEVWNDTAKKNVWTTKTYDKNWMQDKISTGGNCASRLKQRLHQIWEEFFKWFQEDESNYYPSNEFFLEKKPWIELGISQTFLGKKTNWTRNFFELILYEKKTQIELGCFFWTRNWRMFFCEWSTNWTCWRRTLAD